MKDAGRVALTFIAGLVVVFAGALTYSRAHGSAPPIQTSSRAHFESKSAVNNPASTVLNKRPPGHSSEVATTSNVNSAADHIASDHIARIIFWVPGPHRTRTRLQLCKLQNGNWELRAGNSNDLIGFSAYKVSIHQERSSTEVPVAMPPNPSISNIQASSASLPQAEPAQPAIQKPQSLGAQDQAAQQQRYTPAQQAEYSADHPRLQALLRAPPRRSIPVP